MSSMSAFFKKNKKTRPNQFYVATQSLTDANGEPLSWEIKALTTRETDAIRDKCTYEVPIQGKVGQYRTKLDASYATKLICASVVVPDLLDKDLQDSYGVRTPEDLVRELVDNPAEWDKFFEFIQNMNEEKSMQEQVDEAKN